MSDPLFLRSRGRWHGGEGERREVREVTQGG